MYYLTSDHLVFLILCLLSLEVKHFLGDFVLQNRYMLGKTKVRGWVLPLLAHTGVQAGLTALVLLPLVGPMALAFGLADGAIHFMIDMWKARFTEANVFHRSYWIAFGVDQLAHHVTYIAFAVVAFVYVIY